MVRALAAVISCLVLLACHDSACAENPTPADPSASTSAPEGPDSNPGDEVPVEKSGCVGHPLAPGMLVLLKDEIEKAIDRRHIKDRFDRFRNYARATLDAHAALYTGSELAGNCRLKWYDHLMRNPLTSAGEAESLMEWVRASGADCLIGMISVFPKDIGKADSAIVTVGSEKAWKICGGILKTLAGKSAYIGENPKALAALYASLVLPRQGFMFGMIYGALLCEKAGVSMDAYVEQLPLTIKVVHDYYDLFAATVPSDNFTDPPASMGTY